MMFARLFLFAFVTIASLVFSIFFLDEEQALVAYIDLGYINIAILAALASFYILRGNVHRAISWARDVKNAGIIVACILASTYLFTREGPGFKIAFDEQVLTNVSMNLHEHHVPVISESPLIGYSRYELLDKRPLLFPFVLSLTHDIIGYRSSNGFYVNGLLTLFMLLALAILMKRVASRRVAYISIILAACMPLIGQSSSGSGFEILNLCCILIVVWLGLEYWKNPTNAAIARLAFAGVLAAQVRYESVLIAIPIAALIIVKSINEKKVRMPWILCSVPLFFIPLVWQQRAVAANPERYQYTVDNEQLFSIDHLAPNLDSAFRFFFIPSNLYAGSPFIGFVGAAGILAIAAFTLTRKKEIYSNNPSRVALLFFSLYLIPLALLLSVFYFGQFDNPIVSRLALPLILAFIIAGSILLGSIQKLNNAARVASYAFILATILYASKLYANPRYKDTNFLHARIEWILDFSNKLPEGEYLFISTMPPVFEIEKMNALHMSRARKSLEKLAKQQEFKTYRDIFVIQNFMLETVDDKLTALPLPHNDLGPAVKLETLSEASFALYNFSRISRVVDINLALDVEEVPVEQNSNVVNSTQFKSPNEEETKTWRKALP